MKTHEFDSVPERRGTVTRVLTILLVIMLLLALLCLAAPTARKKEMLKSVGEDLESTLTLVPALISYYDGSSIATLAQNPTDNTSYRYISDALGALRTAGGFDSAMLILQSGKQYICAADGLLDSGYNYYAAGTLLSLEKPMLRTLNSVFDGSGGGIVNDLVEARMGGDAVCVILPVCGADGTVISALAVQYGVGETQHHMLFGINLYAAFGVFAGIAAVIWLLLFLGAKIRARRKESPVGEDTFPPAEDVNNDVAPEKKAEKKSAEKKPDEQEQDFIETMLILDDEDEDNAGK